MVRLGILANHRLNLVYVFLYHLTVIDVDMAVELSMPLVDGDDVVKQFLNALTRTTYCGDDFHAQELA